MREALTSNLTNIVSAVEQGKTLEEVEEEVRHAAILSRGETIPAKKVVAVVIEEVDERTEVAIANHHIIAFCTFICMVFT